VGRPAGVGTHYPIHLTASICDAEGNPVETVTRVDHLPSVTSILEAVLAKPGLYAWYYNMALEAVGLAHRAFGEKLPHDPASMKQIIKTMGNSPWQVRNTAGDKGRDIHSDLEALCEGKRPKRTPENAGLLEWWKARGLTPAHVVACEQKMFSLKHSFAGTLDLIYKHPVTSSLVLADLKTGTSVHWSQFVQGSAYKIAWNEWHPEMPVDQISIIHVRPKGNGKGLLPDGWKEHVYSPNDRAFLSILDIYGELPEDWLPSEME
jgi:hypothetical protein